MINSQIKIQLEKNNINLPCLNEDIYSFIIHKKDTEKVADIQKVDLLKDHYYIIKLEHYITNPPDTFTLSSNWNRGIIPKSEYLLGTPVKFMGKMTQWDCCGYNYKNKESLNDTYTGLWLPQASFKIMEEFC